MKEFDFDELDKAVNSLMAEAKPAETSVSAPVAASVPTQPVQASSPPTAAPTDTTTSVPRPVVERAPPVVKPPVVAPTRVSQPLAPKRSGRFMDVVHPSSDMTQTFMSTAMRPRSTSRQGLDIAPPTRASEASLPADQNPESTQPDVSEANVPVTLPDPIDFATETRPKVEETKLSSLQHNDDLTTVVAEDSPSTPVPESEVVAPSEVPVSPFLPGAKPEKRPLDLGLSSDQSNIVSPEPAAASVKDIQSADSTDKADDAVAQPEILSPELPAELHTDLLAVESGQKAADSQPQTESNVPPPSLSPATSTNGSVSIAQQYKIETKTEDTSHTPVYDTASQALTHPAKKKSGWLGVLLIIVILGLFVGAAAVFYYAGLI